jgi:hypothetical protein
MASDAWELRTARLEGAYEQIDGRLGTLERGLERVEQKLDSNFRWVIGVIFANWITLILAIFLRR